MAYETQPGTIPHRVVEYLRTLPEGSKVRTPELCEKLDIDPNGCTTCLRPARDAGLLVAERISGSKAMEWSLGDGVAPLAEPDDDKPIQRHMKIADAPLNIPRLASSNAFGGPLKPLVFVPEPEEVQPIVANKMQKAVDECRAWLSGKTGALVLIGLVLDDEGHATLEPAQVKIIRELLA